MQEVLSIPDSLKLTDRVAIVTGCGSETGIGWWTAASLGRLGVNKYK